MSTNHLPSMAEQVEELLGIPRVVKVTGHSKTWIYERVNDGTFPKPIRIGRRTLWVMSEVQAWVRNRISDARATDLK